MSDTRISADKNPPKDPEQAPNPKGKLPWEAPKMEDVSEEVMAQPYIRFT